MYLSVKERSSNMYATFLVVPTPRSVRLDPNANARAFYADASLAPYVLARAYAGIPASCEIAPPIVPEK